jgi:hypothetical protein
MKHMASTTATGHGGSSAKYKTENHHDRNKTRDGLKLIKGLEQRKAWRIKKYSTTPQAQLSSTTRTLFRHWGIPLLGPKKVAVAETPVIHKRWGRKQ